MDHEVDPRVEARWKAYVLLLCASTAFGMWQRDIAAGLFFWWLVLWFTTWLKS